MNSKHNVRTNLPEIIVKLQDPHLVSSFQQYFGVHPIETFKNGIAKSDISQSVNGNHQNGISKKRHSRNHVAEIPASYSVEDTALTQYKINSRFWYYVFNFGTSLGYEVFYALFFSFWTWNLNSAISRRVINIWVVVMYIGQALKDIICWSRPSSPPVIHLEPKYIPEYGMPSTHAMVSLALPFSTWYFTSQRYEIPFFGGLVICSVWCLLVCGSRLYMGMHTVLDIIAGLLLTPVIMCMILPFSDVIDRFQETVWYSPLITVLVMAILQMIYPRTQRWSPARGDTSIILGTGTGFACGSWLNYQLGLSHPTSVMIPELLFWPSGQLILSWIARLVAGIGCFLVIRTILKQVIYPFFCLVQGLDYKCRESKQKPSVEVPTEYVTYTCMGLVIQFIAPLLFNLLYIQRESMYVEA